MTDVQPQTILIVDDTAAKRYILSTWLRRNGFAVVEAVSAREALRRIGDGTIDLAIIDVQLPDMHGFAVCRHIKRDARTASIPVLHVSAIAVRPADRIAGLDGGADAYLTDPIDPQELLATVRVLLRQSHGQRRAERLAARLRQLNSGTLRLNLAATAERLAAIAAEIGRELFGAGAVVTLVTPKGLTVARAGAPPTLAASGASGTPGSDGLSDAAGGAAGGDVGVDVGPGSSTGPSSSTGVGRSTDREAATNGALLAAVSALRRPVFLDGSEPGGWSVWSALLPPTVTGGWKITPVRAYQSTTGVIAVRRPAGDGSESAEDDLLAGELSRSIAVAQTNLRTFAEEHRIAVTLQRSLLPATLPALPGLRIAARYQASSEQAEIGGDFFDAFPHPDGSATLVIGDVQGHSLAAALVMAQLRYSLRAYTHEGHSPADVFVRLNELLLFEHPEMTATACMLVFPPDRRQATVINAGHIPPLVMLDGRTHFLEEAGTLLGIESEAPVPTSLPLRPGARLLLTTDGLVERRGASLDTGLAALRRTVGQSGATIDALADDIMATTEDIDDDVALIIVEIV